MQRSFTTRWMPRHAGSLTTVECVTHNANANAAFDEMDHAGRGKEEARCS